MTARLIESDVPERPEAVALLLHGGASRRGRMRVSPAQLSVLRMVPIARRTARAGGGRLAVYRLLNSVRGWDTEHTPLRDASWALDEIAERLGRRLPTCLIGHSLGGRAALLAVGASEVRSAVALAPWVYPTDSPRRAAGRRILIAHGSRDRIADPRRSPRRRRGARPRSRGHLRLRRGWQARDAEAPRPLRRPRRGLRSADPARRRG